MLQTGARFEIETQLHDHLPGQSDKHKFSQRNRLDFQIDGIRIGKNIFLCRQMQNMADRSKGEPTVDRHPLYRAQRFTADSAPDFNPAVALAFDRHLIASGSQCKQTDPALDLLHHLHRIGRIVGGKRIHFLHAANRVSAIIDQMSQGAIILSHDAQDTHLGIDGTELHSGRVSRKSPTVKNRAVGAHHPAVKGEFRRKTACRTDPGGLPVLPGHLHHTGEFADQRSRIILFIGTASLEIDDG